MKISSCNIQIFLIFSQKKAFLIFWDIKTLKNSLYLSKRNAIIFQETETLKIKINILRKCFIFQDMELSTLKLKFFYIAGENLQNLKIRNFLYISFHIFCLLRENFSNISTKEKSFLYFPYNEAIFSKLKYFLISNAYNKAFFLIL